MAYFDIYEEGQKAFEENKSISDYPSHYNKTQHKAWKDGYLEAQHRDEVEKELGRWNSFSADCPWHERGLDVMGVDGKWCGKGLARFESGPHANFPGRTARGGFFGITCTACGRPGRGFFSSNQHRGEI